MSANNKSRWRAWLSGIVILLVAAAAMFLIAGQAARNRLAKQYPAPGSMVMAHNHKLHVRCAGNGPLTVFLVAGLNDFSLQWSGLQPLLARETKTCAYDRAGLGWSEAASHPPTLENAVSDMREVLRAIDGNHPVILVGHSFGAILVRMYAQQYPDDVQAIVLLDPASEHMPERILGYASALETAASQFKRLSTFSSTGLLALVAENIPPGLLHGEALAQYRAVLASGSYFAAASAETGEMINNLHAMQATGKQIPARIPVVVISRGQPEPIPGLPEASAQSLELTWQQLQADLVKKMQARHVVAGQSGHSIHLTQPELVADAIRPLLSPAQK